jgi:hypothetical protein
MDTQRLLTNLSNKILIQFVAVILIAVALIAYNFDSVYPFYTANQLTNTGLIINSAIVALFLLGIGNICYHLLRYRSEEIAIADFLSNVEALKTDYFEGLRPDSIIAQRHITMRAIQRANGEINHSALASMLNADEASRFGLIRFINNILILTGVFGTIVSLSIALLGASDLIDSADASLGGMGLVIHGMSTALSTTITAIVSYALFGYFYTRLSDVQSHCQSGIEHLTSVYLLPQYVRGADDIAHKLGDLIKSVILAADRLRQTQDTYHDAAITLQQTIAANHQQADRFVRELDQIKRTLREGFRLPPQPDQPQPNQAKPYQPEQ